MAKGKGKGAGLERSASESIGVSASSYAESEACPDALVWTDTRRRILDCNPAAERLLKATAESMRGRDILSFFEGEAPSSRQSRCRLRNGGTVPVSVSVVRDGRRNPTGFVYRFLPAEGFPRAVGGMIEQDGILDGIIREELLAAMGEVTSKLAHDVSSPLTAITGYAQVIMESTEDAEIREGLGVIQNEAKRVYAMIQGISSLIRERRAEKRAPTSVNACIESVLGLHRRRLEEEGIRVETDMAPDLPPVMADARQMEIVFWNLLRNAEEAMGGRGKLAIRTGARNGKVIVSVADSGPGIPETAQEGLFEPFFTTKPDVGAIGLGLTICRRIIRGHGGCIRAENADGAGAMITIELPARAVEEE